MTDDAEWLRQLDGEFTLATRQRLERIASILDNEAARYDDEALEKLTALQEAHDWILDAVQEGSILEPPRGLVKRLAALSRERDRAS